MDVWDVGDRTENLISSIEYAFTLQSREILFSSLPVSHAGYVQGTGIVRIDQKRRSLEVIQYIWSPMILDFKAMVLSCHIPNREGIDITTNQIQVVITGAQRRLMVVKQTERTPEGLWVSVVLVDREGHSEATLKDLRQELEKASPSRLLQAEKRWWMHWHHLEDTPSRIYGKHYDLLMQSAAFLKMAQCREPGPSHGQIVSHLDRQAKRAQPRDMAYAILALASLGHFTESRKALDFLFNARAGTFQRETIHDVDWGLDSKYQISLHHYTGLGYERSNYTNGTPLIHLDGPALILWAFHKYVQQSSDVEYAAHYWPLVEDQIIFPLVESMGEERLLRRSSGLQDVVAPGEHFTFSNSAAYVGLNHASVLARALGHRKTGHSYARIAAVLREAILSKCVVGRSKVLTRSLEQKSFPFFLDASAVEAINWHVIEDDWKSTQSTLDALDAFLVVQGRPRGYALGYAAKDRLGHENVFISFRAITALTRAHRRKRANELFEWTLGQLQANSFVIPEYFHRDHARYTGHAPMMGRGAGVCILMLLNANL
jgi:GH15 family glucan-1,4-alpha-glucosidase